MDDDRRSDADLLALARVQPDALGVLYARHAGAVHRYLARRVGTQSADDLLGEVFVAALSARLRVVPHVSGSALPWLYGIAGNLVRTHLRRRTRTPAADGVGRGRPIEVADPVDGAAVDWAAVDARLDARALREDLRAAVADLGDVDRELLLLIAWEGLTPTEAAAALDLTPLAARSRLHRARLRAQATLDARARARV